MPTHVFLDSFVSLSTCRSLLFGQFFLLLLRALDVSNFAVICPDLVVYGLAVVVTCCGNPGAGSTIGHFRRLFTLVGHLGGKTNLYKHTHTHCAHCTQQFVVFSTATEFNRLNATLD